MIDLRSDSIEFVGCRSDRPKKDLSDSNQRSGFSLLTERRQSSDG